MVKSKLKIAILVMLVLIFAKTAVASSNTITAIEIRGNSIVSDSEIMQVITVEIGDQINPDRLRADLQRIFDLGWFYDVSIDFEPYQGGVKLIFNLKENYATEGIRILGNEVLSDEELMELLDLEAGQVLNTAKLEQGLAEIEKTYQEQGYILVQIRNVSLDDDGFLEIIINEGYLGRIHISGNEKTHDYVIEREIDLKEGEVFNVNRIQRALQNIYFLGYFSENLNTNLELVDPQQNIADIFIEVEEIDTGSFFFGGGYNTQTKLFASISLEERNLLGRGQEISLSGEIAQKSRSINLNFQEPYFLNTPFSLGTAFYWSFLESEEGEDDDLEVLEQRRIGGHITTGYSLTSDLTLSTRLRLDHSETLWFDTDGVQTDQDQGQTRSVTIMGVRNTTLSPINPREGGRESISYELAGYPFGGDFDFHKVSLDLRRYYPGFTDNQSWAFRFKSGAVFWVQDIHNQDLFRIGGSETLRGYDFGEMRGDMMLLFNAEYRYKIYEIIDGAVFFDTGYAWNTLKGESFDWSEVGIGIGTGVRLSTPLGQIRFDLGLNRDFKLKPHFSIGQTF